MTTNFEVIGLTRLGIKPECAAPETDALTTRPFELLSESCSVEDKFESKLNDGRT